MNRFFARTTSSTSPFAAASFYSARRYAARGHSAHEDTEKPPASRDGPGISYGLNAALARTGVIVKDRAFKNLTTSELRQRGATMEESLSGIPMYIRGNFLVRKSEITKAQFSRLLKQATTHMSSVSDIFVHDGAIGSSPGTDAKVRVISDSPAAASAFHKILWQTPTRAVSHDSCPLTVYVASSISLRDVDVFGLGSKVNNGFIAGDADRSSLVLFGRAFTDINSVRKALSSLAEPIIISRGGLLLPARILVSCGSVFLLFAPDDTIRGCSKQFVADYAGPILSSGGVSTVFRTANPESLLLSGFPAAIVLASSDSSGVIPTISKLSPGQAAYHFLAGYQNGKFDPAYGSNSYFHDPLQIAKTLFSKLVDGQIPSFLVNTKGEKPIVGADFVNLAASIAEGKNVLPFEARGCGEVGRRHNVFLGCKFGQLPREFTF